MADTMRALILKRDGYATERPDDTVLAGMEPFVQLGELPMPEPGEGHVRIKVALASVNPSDETFIQGLYGQPRIKGNAAGFEGVGEVVASGGGPLADGYLGQRVAFVATAGAPGTWSEYSIADAATCIPLIDGVRDEDGAAMIVNPLTALAMFDIVKQDEAKAFIVSAGASQLSKLMIGVAAAEDYRPIAIVRRDSQIEPIKALGAAHVLNSEADDFEQQLSAVLREEKPRVFLDAVANQVSAKVFAAMGRHARWVIYGKLDTELPTLLEPGQLIFMMKRIEGFWLVRWMQETPMADKMAAIQTAQTRFASGEWRTDVTAILSLEEAMTRLPAELAKPNGKVFIKP
jgi:NADPH:quinone reductase-like Zn-dependent oxidoreductase